MIHKALEMYELEEYKYLLSCGFVLRYSFNDKSLVKNVLLYDDWGEGCCGKGCLKMFSLLVGFRNVFVGGISNTC